MHNIRACFTICTNNFRKWSSNYRIYVLLLLIIMFSYNYARPFYEISVLVNQNIPPVIFPFLTSNILTQAMIMSGVIFLFCDAPFIDNCQPYSIIRSGRMKWMTGQILYVFFASAIYLLIIFICTVIMVIPNVSFANDWGSIFFTISQGGQISDISTVSVPYRILLLYTPLEALFISFLLEWGAAVFLGLLMLAINMNFNRAWGIACASIVVLFDAVVYNTMSYWYNRISPVSMARLSILDSSEATGKPGNVYAYLFFIISILILCMVCMICFRKKAIQVMPTI